MKYAKKRLAKNQKFTPEVEKTIQYYLEQEQWSPDVIKQNTKKRTWL